MSDDFETILYEEDGPVGWLTLNRPDDGNMFTPTMCHEIRDCINAVRRETRTRVLVISGAGDRFFCLGGRKEGMEETSLYAGVLPTLEIYESIDRLQKPVIASVNGFAVGGGNVLHGDRTLGVGVDESDRTAQRDRLDPTRTGRVGHPQCRIREDSDRGRCHHPRHLRLHQSSSER